MEVEEKDAVLWVKAVENYLVELRDRIDSLEMSREELIKSNSYLLTKVEDLNGKVEELKRKYESCEDGDDSCETIENSLNLNQDSSNHNHTEDPNVLSNQYTVPETTNHYDEVKPLVYVHQNVLLPMQLHQNQQITSQGTSEYCSESGYQTEKEEQIISESDDHEIDENTEIPDSDSDSESCSDSDSDTNLEETDDQHQLKDLNINKFEIENYDNGDGDEIELNIDIEGETTGSNCETNATQIEETSGPTVSPFFKCPKCPRSFSLQRFLSNHLRFCKKDKILQDNVTNDQNTRTTNSTSVVVESQNSDSKSTSIYSECSDESPQNNKLRTCNFCIKTFSSRYALKCHERIHTGERPYSCKFCEKKFVQKGHLDQHERIHTGIRPFICKFCGRGFPQQTQMSQHLRRCKTTTHNTSSISQQSTKSSNRNKSPEEITINNDNDK